MPRVAELARELRDLAPVEQQAPLAARVGFSRPAWGYGLMWTWCRNISPRRTAA